jgi:hypothetical protein
MELLEPVERVREEEVPHLVPPEVEDERPPVRVRSAARVGVLVEGRPVEPGEGPIVPREVGGDPVEDHADVARVQGVDEGAEVVRRAERRLRRVVPRHLVPPRRPERVLHHRHQLDVREPELGDMIDELVGQVAPAETLTPGARMHLVDRHGCTEGVGGTSPLEPRAVRPFVARAVDERGGVRRCLGTEGQRVGLEPCRAVRPVHGELVRLPLARARRSARPDAGRVLRLERVGVLAPRVPVAHHRHASCVRRPDGEADAGVLVVEGVRAEALPEPLVAPLAEQMEVELSEGRARGAHETGSRTRSMPTIGIVAHSGRFRVS